MPADAIKSLPVAFSWPKAALQLPPEVAVPLPGRLGEPWRAVMAAGQKLGLPRIQKAPGAREVEQLWKLAGDSEMAANR